MNLKRRIRQLESSIHDHPVQTLVQHGISSGRARQLIGPDGKVRFMAFTDDELAQVTGPGVRVSGRVVLWEAISDRQVERLAKGEAPQSVIGKQSNEY